jgi:hypothetical protein
MASPALLALLIAALAWCGHAMAQPRFPVSGAWFDPAQSGHGWMLEELRDADGSRRLLAYWYTYVDGSQRWIFGTGPISAGRARVTLYMTSGADFPPRFDAAAVQVLPWGAADFAFLSDRVARVDWASDLSGFGHGDLRLERLSEPTAPAAGDDPALALVPCHSGTWYEPARPGHGLNLQVLRTPDGGRRAVATWYTYLGGRQAWLLGEGPLVDGVAELATSITSGGQFPPAFAPGQVREDTWGRLRIRTRGPDQLQIDWDSPLPGFGSGSLGLSRLTTLDGRSCRDDAVARVASFDGQFIDTTRSRAIAYRAYYPSDRTGPLPIVLFSHGGDGSTNGHLQLGHFGSSWAAAGYLAIHLNHLPSATITQHYRDRPADVTATLDRLANRSLALPDDIAQRADLTRVAHAGHSWGAYTAYAVGGARYTHGRYGDPRIRALIPISPQGPGGFGAYDNGPGDNTWREVALPALILVGDLERNGPLGNPQQQTDWRLYPYLRGPANPDRFLAVLPGQNHGDMAGGPSADAQATLLGNTRRFLQVYLEGRTDLACDVLRVAPMAGSDRRAKTDPAQGLTRACAALPGNIADATVDEAIGDPAVAYLDPEFDPTPGAARAVFLDSNLNTWVCAIDPRSGRFASASGRDWRIADAASFTTRMVNGPEWGRSVRGTSVYINGADARGIGQIVRADPPFDRPTLTQLTTSTNQTVHAIANASLAPSLPAVLLMGYRGVQAGSSLAWQSGTLELYWIDEREPGQRWMMPFADRFHRWIPETRLSTFASPVTSGSLRAGQIYLHDSGTGVTRTISDDAGRKVSPWGWHAPEFGGELLILAVVDGREIGIWRDTRRDGTPWTRIATLSLPAGSPYTTLNSAEPVSGARGHGGRSWITLEALTPDSGDSSIWLLAPSTGALPPAAVRLDEGIASGAPGIRRDPESLIADGELLVYYTRSISGQPTQLRLVRTGIR